MMHNRILVLFFFCKRDLHTSRVLHVIYKNRPLSSATSANADNMSTFSIESPQCFSAIALATSSIFHAKSRSDSSSSASATFSPSLPSSSSSLSPGTATQKKKSKQQAQYTVKVPKNDDDYNDSDYF